MRQTIEHKGFKVAQRAWVLGEFAHVECFPMSRSAAIDNPCALISEGLRTVGVIVKAKDIRVEHFGKVFVVPVRISGVFALQDFVHSGDYHTLDWQGHLYRLPDRAARMIKFLHEAYSRGDPWCSAEAVRFHMGMKSSQRIDHLFRRQDGPRVLRDLIWSDQIKRRYRIKLSESFGPFHSGT